VLTIIAVHVDDPEYAHHGDIAELPPRRLREREAEQVVRDAVRRYRERVLPTLGQRPRGDA